MSVHKCFWPGWNHSHLQTEKFEFNVNNFWVPWKPDADERYRLRGIRLILWGPLLLAAAIFRRLPTFFFYGGAVVAIAAVWGISWLFWLGHDIEREIGIDFGVSNVNQISHDLGAGVHPLTVDALKLALVTRNPPLPDWLAYVLYPLSFQIVRDLIVVVGVVGFVSVAAMFFIWWERKVSAHIQNRVGPMRVGGWHGWTQSLADGLKLLGKEDLVPDESDHLLFRLAPYFAFVPVVVAFLVLPFGTYWLCRYTDVGLLFILAMLGIEVIGVILAGWASNNKWSLYGAMREACQMVSYEIPMGMVLLLPVMMAGTLDLRAIGDLQNYGWFSWYCFANPFMFFAALVYFIASLASCKRAPFDLAEAESELVAGFLTEYSGYRWALFFFGEYSGMFIVSALATILFFGAWHSPLPPQWTPSWLASSPLWFIGKCVVLVYVQMWLRWTLPRVRIDQMLYACVQVLLPMVMILLLGQTIWLLLVKPTSPLDFVVVFVLGIIGLLIVVVFAGAAIRGFLNRRRLVGYLAKDMLPGG